jgi:hypothetical protein
VAARIAPPQNRWLMPLTFIPASDKLLTMKTLIHPSFVRLSARTGQCQPKSDYLFFEDGGRQGK